MSKIASAEEDENRKPLMARFVVALSAPKKNLVAALASPMRRLAKSSWNRLWSRMTRG